MFEQFPEIKHDSTCLNIKFYEILVEMKFVEICK